MRYLICFSYNGTQYYGWAKQPNLKTVQTTLETSLKHIFNEDVNLIVAARTDKHVHAIKQYCHFDTNIRFYELDRLTKVINRLLPTDIRIINMQIIRNDFHARFSAKSKVYLYIINTSEIYNVFCSNLVYQYGKKIDVSKCQRIFKYFTGKHNFSSFTTEPKYPVERQLHALKLFQKNNLCFFAFHAPSFLRSMIRMIVGTILAYNESKITDDDISKLFTNPSKGKAKFKVPGCGLYLVGVYY